MNPPEDPTPSGGKEGKTGFLAHLKETGMASVLLFLPIIILVNSDAGVILANTILIVADLDTNFQMLGALVAVNFIVAASSTLVFGYLTDKYPRKYLLIFGGFCWAVSDLLTSFAPNIEFMFAIRVTAALGAGAITPVTFSLLSDLFGSERRANSFAWWGIATMVGGLVGGGISLAFNKIDYEALDRMFDTNNEKLAYIQVHYAELVKFWRFPLLLMGILGIVFTIVIIFLKEPKRGAKEQALKEVLEEENVEYERAYKIKKEDLKYIFTRKSNFFLIINFFDTVFSGVLAANIIAWITVEMGFNVSFDLSSPFFWMIVVLLLLVGGLGFGGQFFFARWGDRKVRGGDLAGRVKVAIFCGVLHVPFLVVGFIFAPNVGDLTFFSGKVHVTLAGFWVLLLLMAAFIALGFAGSNGIAPNWYSSLIDVNLPEHRGTMIATASFLDALGRAFGAWVGGTLIQHFTDTGRGGYAIGLTLIWMTTIFGALSCLLWVPIYKYCNRDFKEVHEILAQRAEELRQRTLEAREHEDVPAEPSGP
ncbi:MAG: MFS transporter [Promethearchaeota archaeon]